METLKVLQSNLTFSEALQALKEKKLISLPEWDGYWFLRGGKIMVKTWDGQELDTPWLKETVLREDWKIVEVDLDDMFKKLNSQPIQFYKTPENQSEINN